MTGAIVVAVILVALVVPSVIVGARLGRRLGTRPGDAPAKIARRVWFLTGASLAIGIAAAAWLSWAIDHHHAALGVLVVVGVYFAAHFGLLALRYRRHRRAAPK